mgnify:CR=1 FL=1
MKPFILFLRESSYTGWKHEDPVKYSKHLSKTFGNPDELTNYRAVWYNKDGVKRIEVKDEYILHGSPAPHYDFVYSYIDLKVPHEIADELADSSESIMIDFLKNEVGARCGSLTANAVTLNYVLDVVAKRVRPSKEEYEKRIKSMISMFDNKKIYSNDWWPDETKDADPKNPYYKKGSIEEAARIPRKAGQPANSKKHSDLYTDENPKGTIHGLKFTTREDAKRSIRKIKSSGRKHAHKIQAAIAMEQRARVAGKTQAASVYRSFIEQMKKKTKKMNENIDEASPVVAAMMRAKARISPSYKIAKQELKDKIKKDPKKAKISHAAAVAKKYSGVDARKLHDVTEERKGLYYYINKKRKEGRPMRKKGSPGAPKPSDFDKAKKTVKEDTTRTSEKGAPGTLKAKIKGKVTMAKVNALKNKPGATPHDKAQANWFINMQRGKKK